MRTPRLLTALLLIAACGVSQDDPAEAASDGEGVEAGSDGGEAETGREPGDEPEVEPLPENVDLELSTTGSQYFVFASCPAQDSVHLRVAVTAPSGFAISAAGLRSFDLEDVLQRDGLDVAGVLSGLPRPEAVEPGERGVFVFNVPIEGGPALCPTEPDDMGEAIEATIELDVHGSVFEVVGEVELACLEPAPHTC